MIIVLIWRIWQLRNDITHGKDATPMNVSVDFLQSYCLSLNNAEKYSSEEILKGKIPMFDIAAEVHPIVTPVLSWPRPPCDKTCVSIDGSF